MSKGIFLPFPDSDDMESMNKKVKDIERKVLRILIDNDYLPSSKSCTSIISDILELGLDRFIYLSQNFSPSQLGRMLLLGCRWMAICRRDYPDKYKKIISQLRRELQ